MFYTSVFGEWKELLEGPFHFFELLSNNSKGYGNLQLFLHLAIALFFDVRKIIRKKV